MIVLSADCMDILYDNSKAFDTFLKKQGMDRILRTTDLKMRVRHTIVPHVRIHIVYVSLGLYSWPVLFHSESTCHCIAHQMLFQSSRTMRAGTVMYVVHQLIHIYKLSKQHFSGIFVDDHLVRKIHRASASIKTAPDCFTCILRVIQPVMLTSHIDK